MVPKTLPDSIIYITSKSAKSLSFLRRTFAAIFPSSFDTVATSDPTIDEFDPGASSS